MYMHAGSPVHGIDSTFGPGSGPITLDNVVCAGTEDNLLSCSHNQIFQHNCDHSEDVAVICDGEFRRIKSFSYSFSHSRTINSAVYRWECQAT